MAATVTSRGQITLRKEFLNHLNIATGEKVDIAKMPDGSLSIRPIRRMGKIEDIFGMLKGKSKVKLTIEQMNKVIEDGWAGKL
jgi:antitoxin PrlF